MRVNREEFLQKLETVFPGTTSRGMLEQSNCFVFKEGIVHTFNDEIACQLDIGIGHEIEGAVQAKPLIEILQQMTCEELTLSIREGHLILAAKNEEVGVAMESSITLATDSVEPPEEWTDMHVDFTDAIKLIQECAGKDESNFAITCIHIHPKFLEAHDGIQHSRYRMKTGVKKATIVRRDSIKHITAMDMTEISETDNWLHFRNPSGLVISFRRYLDPYEDLTEVYESAQGGTMTTIPKGLGKAASKAEVFSKENIDDPRVLIKMMSGRLLIRGMGSAGFYKGKRAISYKGPKISFLVRPKLLVELTKRFTECYITKDKLRVESGKYIYVVCFGLGDN